jgi:aldehyde dehydrogenase (NAD+)
MTDIKKFPLIINGVAIEPTGGIYEDVINPANGNVVAQIAKASKIDVENAIKSAKTALKSHEWTSLSAKDRAKILINISRLIVANAGELAQLEILSSGGTISRIMNVDIPLVVDIIDSTARAMSSYKWVENLNPKSYPEIQNGQIVKTPVGVCALISPWNYPLFLIATKISAAIAAGCTMVVKPSSLTPTSTQRLVELISSIVPKGVINFVCGDNDVVGETLISHPLVNKIAFTGSTAVGKHISQVASQSNKRITLELGGKGAAIIEPDADIYSSSYSVIFGGLLNGGQSCESSTRLLVHEDIHDKFVDELVKRANNLIVGDTLDWKTSYGPVSTQKQFNTIMGYIESAKQDGGKIVCGGKKLEIKGCENGFFIAPTIITNIKNSYKCAREEIFGPVLVVIKYKTLEEAIEIANDSNYGLSVGIFSGDVVKAQHTALKLESGAVWINDWHLIRSDTPFGGVKESGLGREMNRFAIDSYVESKAVITAFESNPKNKFLQNTLHKNYNK